MRIVQCSKRHHTSVPVQPLVRCTVGAAVLTALWAAPEAGADYCTVTFRVTPVAFGSKVTAKRSVP